jgi:small-conductance mechanosensitive channel
MAWLLENLRVELFTFGGSVITPLSLAGLVLFLVLITLFGRLVRRATSRLITRGDPQRTGVGYAVGRIAQYVAVVVGVLVALENLGFNLTALAAVGTIVGVGMGLGLQNFALNFVSGLVLLIERPVQRGDFLVVGDVVGRVREISMRSTTILSRDGVAIVLPNSELVSGKVFNLTQPSPEYRAKVRVTAPAGADPREVRELLLDVAGANEDVLGDPPPSVALVELGPGGYTFELYVWIDRPSDEQTILSDLRFAIDAAQRERGFGEAKA